ncbi:MAG: hypothetical protein ACXVBE_01450 [Bdellovibrionota bacterium]
MSNLLPSEYLNLTYAEEAAQSRRRAVEMNLNEIKYRITSLRNRVSSAADRIRENTVPISITAVSALAVILALRHGAHR